MTHREINSIVPKQICLPSYEDVLGGKMAVAPCVHQNALVKAIHEINLKKNTFHPVPLRSIETHLKRTSLKDFIPTNLGLDIPILERKGIIKQTEVGIELSPFARELLMQQFPANTN